MTVKEGMDRMNDYFKPISKGLWDKVGNPARKRKVVEVIDELEDIEEYTCDPSDDYGTEE